MKKRLFLMMVGGLAQIGVLAQTFSTEFSAEMQRTEGSMEVAPQLKGILEMPINGRWSAELELASSQAGLDYRIDARFEIGAPVCKMKSEDSPTPSLSLLAGASSGDACKVHFADLGLAAAWEKYECAAIVHYAPFSPERDRFLELTAQRNLGCVYLQPGLYVNHAAGDVSLTAVLTVGISLGIKN